MRIRPAHIVFTVAATAYVLVVSLLLSLVTPAHAAELPPGVLVMVNDRPITKTLVDTVAQQLGARGQAADDEQIIDELINLELLTEAAEAVAIDQRPEVAAALQLQYVQTMANAYLATLSASLSISDGQLRAAYERDIAGSEPLEYRTRHILVHSEGEARAIIQSLDNGADFDTLARDLSSDASTEEGGDLGWLGSAAMVPEYAHAVEDMAVGEHSNEPVRSAYGWHVIRLDDTRNSARIGFETSRPALKQRLLRDSLQEKVTALRETARIER